MRSNAKVLPSPGVRYYIEILVYGLVILGSAVYAANFRPWVLALLPLVLVWCWVVRRYLKLSDSAMGEYFAEAFSENPPWFASMHHLRMALVIPAAIFVACSFFPISRLLGG